MTIQYRTTLRNNRLDQVTADIGTNAYLRFYDGTKPTNPGTALSGNTLLAELRGDAAAWAAAASAGTLTANAIVQANASASSSATFFRIYKSDGTTCVAQGTVTATGGGGDITLTTIVIASGQPVSVSSYVTTEGNA